MAAAALLVVGIRVGALHLYAMESACDQISLSTITSRSTSAVSSARSELGSSAGSRGQAIRTWNDGLTSLRDPRPTIIFTMKRES